MDIEVPVNESEVDPDKLAKMYIRSVLRGGETLPRSVIADRVGKKVDEVTVSRNLLSMRFAGEIELIDQKYRMKQ